MEATAVKLNGLSQVVLSNTTKYIEKYKLTKEEFSNRVGISRPVISKVMNGRYDGNTENIENVIVNFLKQEGEYTDILPVEEKTTDIDTSKKTGERPEFLKTNDSSEIIGVCQACQELHALGIVVGKSGFGKTYTLKQYAKFKKVCYIECDDTMSTKDLVEAIQNELGIPSSYGSVWKRVSGIKDFFNVNKGYVIIIDEADKLINKYTQKKLELLRAIYDQCEVGLVISGEPRLETLIKGYLNRFANRIDFYTSLKGLTKQEAREYLSNLNITDEALNELVARATGSQISCFRLLDRTLNNIFRIIGKNDEITPETIERASSMMMYK